MFDTEIILENEFVELRPLQIDDIALLSHFAISEPTIWKYSLMQIQNENDLAKYVEQAIEARDLKKEYPFIVFDKKKKEYAGSTRFYDIQLQFQTLQLGYTWYGSEFQGTHVNPNCKLLLLEYAFETLNMERVEFRADNRNARSIKAMKSLGCVEEGILRNHLPTIDGGRRDSIILSILKTEWENGVKERLIARTSK
jgi:RimJ/RimL family protein N-acetyltransferase